MLLFGASYLGVRRAMIKDQRRPMPCSVPLWRLLLDEVVLLADRIGRWKVWSVLGVAFICVLATEVLLSSATPGPALAELWRWLVALVMTGLTLFVWTAVHALRSVRRDAGALVRSS